MKHGINYSEIHPKEMEICRKSDNAWSDKETPFRVLGISFSDLSLFNDFCDSIDSGYFVDSCTCCQ